ncbi:sensor histidine kinase [Solimicrobium silvestre]|uniref:histidine kinase n=1 Tax=Solimicrobium silvestre TaxID=2099400 RepID=A0A2S9GU28_9BURK|nr:hybrid sensor histidine kinase/response regulator [Solimicrobium silvestre]PRC91237.1 Histidine kinase-, DNA gyrase B-, and HSP90-like ATPase [Solimicrobium silvestre]
MNKNFVILIVDDNLNNRFSVRELLVRIPHTEIIEAASGEKSLLLTIERDVHLILLDVQMPGMDGYETANILQMTERTRDIPIIFLTAVFKAEEFVKRGYALGAVDYLTKPLDDNILLNRVRHYQHLHERERKLSETLVELRTTRENLLQVEKFSALGTMVAGVSHELNTPLGNAKMAASTLHDRIVEIKKNYDAGTMKRNQIEQFFIEGEEITALVHRALDRAVDLVLNFKQVAVDQTSEQRSTFDFATVIEETIATLLINFKHEPWQVVLKLPSGIEIDSYPGSLEQIIVNLVHNSIRHGFHGRDHGCITINAYREHLPNKLYDQIVLIFSDDGVGIAPENLNRVFDPFFTTRLGQGGSGMGLSVCYRITTVLLGGSIEVETSSGSGTTFKLTFPLTAPVMM